MSDIEKWDYESAGPDGSGSDGNQMPDGGEDSPPEYFVGELTQDDVVSRLNQIPEFSNQLRSLEGTAMSRMGGIEKMIGSLQGSLPTQVKFDASKLSRIAKYDPALAEAIAQDLQEALSVFALNADTLAPFLKQTSDDLQNKFNADLVDAHHGDVAEFAPMDWSHPQTQREKDYVQWYNTVSTWEQKKQLEARGVGAVRALNSFKEWERKKNEDLNAAAKKKEQRLRSGMQPMGERGRSTGRKITTEEEGFLSAFEN